MPQEYMILLPQYPNHIDRDREKPVFKACKFDASTFYKKNYEKKFFCWKTKFSILI